MFTVLACILLAALASLVSWRQKREAVRRARAAPYDDDQVRHAVMHSRQDIQLIAYLLAGILIMLGVVADRLP